ncbi:MAG: Fur family transcriptional regulator [Syntrophorhabdaceae bacterium]|jgi:Fe2+ or Zn2+ uptake regulation protein|nr:transcriptional repressor [Syntrophorhabdaceae bacterium]MDD4196623.1 Fur family transcriptional regulator [Syntrophorhabdaceae bacterium]HOC45562.1 Fur family transcriptional regulator [Syntrophorhabdaceae bacterium]
MDSTNREEEILDALKKKGVRLTRQRTEIIRVLCRHGNHPSAGAILKEARKMVPSISVSTVYYTLGLLKKEGLIKELEFYDMENRYESVMTDHIDLVCTECGRIENLIEKQPLTYQAIENLTGFRARGMRHEYYGLCGTCRRGKE